MDHQFKKIEIRVEHVVHDDQLEENFYFIYVFIDDQIQILGKTKVFPNIFKYKSIMKD